MVNIGSSNSSSFVRRQNCTWSNGELLSVGPLLSSRLMTWRLFLITASHTHTWRWSALCRAMPGMLLCNATLVQHTPWIRYAYGNVGFCKAVFYWQLLLINYIWLIDPCLLLLLFWHYGCLSASEVLLNDMIIDEYQQNKTKPKTLWIVCIILRIYIITASRDDRTCKYM